MASLKSRCFLFNFILVFRLVKKSVFFYLNVMYLNIYIFIYFIYYFLYIIYFFIYKKLMANCIVSWHFMHRVRFQ